MNTASVPTSNAPEAIAPAVVSSTRPKPDVGGALGERLHAVVEHAVADGRVRGGGRRACSRWASVGSVASFTFTVVAAAIRSPTKPLTAPAAARSAER